MRSVFPNGTVSAYIVNGSKPWAEAWNGPETIVFGHDAVRRLQQYPHAIGIDTGCVYGGKLTAIRWPSRELVSVPAKGSYVKVHKPKQLR